jgi:hypothetical protein
MPNNFGGDQHHPAYDGSRLLSINEVVIGNLLYTIHGRNDVTYESVEGQTGRAVYLPPDVEARMNNLYPEGENVP